MLIRTIRRAFAPRNLAATVILTVAASGVAYAAIGSAQITNNSITGLDIKNSSVTGLDIKNRSLLGADLKNNSLGGKQVNESALGKVPSAGTADSATNATNATKATSAASADTAKLAEKASGQSRIASGFLSVSAEDNDPVVARAAATPVTLVSAGTLSVQALCFRDIDADAVFAEVIATTTVDAAVLDSWEDDLSGGATVNNTTFLFTDTARNLRQVYEANLAVSDVFQVRKSGNGQWPFTLAGIDGSYITGGVTGMVRNGTPVGAPSTLPGTEHSCAFFGEATHSGTA